MKQFTVKAYHLNPVNVLCLVMLAITMTAVLLGGKPADKAELPAAVPVAKEIMPVSNPFANIEAPIDWNITKDFQIEIAHYGKRGRCAIIYDRGRVVRVLPLDNQCNLTYTIEHDQE